MSLTLAQTRRAVGQRVGSCLVGTATAAGDVDRFVDTIRLVRDNAFLTGATGVFATGTAANVGRRVRVTGNVRDTGTVTFAPSLSAATAAGDVLELYGDLDASVGIDEIDDAIRRAVRIASHSALVPALGDTLTWDTTSPRVAIPADWWAVSGAEVQWSDGIWRGLPPADILVSKHDRTLSIGGWSGWRANGLGVRLLGWTVPAAPVDDDDTVDVHEGWIEAHAASELCMAVAMRLDPNLGTAFERRSATLAQEAQLLKPAVARRPTGRLWTVRTA